MSHGMPGVRQASRILGCWAIVCATLGPSPAAAATQPFVDATVEARSPPLAPELLVARERYDPVTRQQALYLRVFEDSSLFGVSVREAVSGRLTLTGATIAEVLYRIDDVLVTDPGGGARFEFGIPGAPYAGPGRGLEGNPRTANPVAGSGIDAIRYDIGGQSVDFYFESLSDVDDVRIIIQYPTPPGSASFSVELFVPDECAAMCGVQQWPPGNVRGVVVGEIEPSAVPDDGVFAGATALDGVRLLVRDFDVVESSIDLGESLAGASSGTAFITLDNFEGAVDRAGDNGIDHNGPFGRVDGLPFPANVDLTAVRFVASDLVGPSGIISAGSIGITRVPVSVPAGAAVPTSVVVAVPPGQPTGLYQGTLRAFEDANGDTLDNDGLSVTVPTRLRVVSVLTPDAGLPDAGTPPDAGVADAGVVFDAGVADAGVPDAGVPDAGPDDAGAPDAGAPDAGVADAGVLDAGVPDAGVVDAGLPDAGVPDAGVPDAGVDDTRLKGGACGCAPVGPGSRGTAHSSWLLLTALLCLAWVRRRRAKARAASAAALLLGLTFGVTVWGASEPRARAQSRGAAPDVQQLRPSSAEAGYLVGDGARVLAPGDVALGFTFGYAKSPLVRYRGASRVGDVVSDLASADFTAAFGLFGAVAGPGGQREGLVQLGIAFPLVFMSGTRSDGAALPSASAGDVRFLPKVRLYWGKHLKLAFVPELTFPSGDPTTFSGESSVSFAPRLNVELVYPRLQAAFSVAYRFREAVRVGNVLFDDELAYRGAVAWKAHPRVTLTGELFGGTSAVYPFKREAESYMELLASARVHVGANISLVAGGGAGLLPGYGTPSARFFLGIAYAPATRLGAPIVPRIRVADRDGDGVPDDRDACPDVPAATPDGCPPARAAVALTTTPPLAPTADRDGDGVPDRVDACPDQAGPASADGCPDTDGDGIPDHKDRCPTLAEDKDGFADADGCPDPDNDFDGLADAKDAQPLEPAPPKVVLRSVAEPEVAKAAVRFFNQRMLIVEKVRFAEDGRTFTPASLAALDRVAAAVKTHDIIKLRIDGHVEELPGWSKAARLQLSEQLAERVLGALVQRGVDRDRLAARGRGASRPLVPKDAPNPAGENRRVEFVVVER